MRLKKLWNIILLSCLIFTLNGCYLIKQGIYLIRYNSHGKSLDKLIDDPATGEKLKEFSKVVKEIRMFAKDSIGLAINKSYTRMVEVDRGYVAVFVSAAERLSFIQHKWCFPIVGCMPYKGYFDVKDAKKEAQKLSDDGYDVSISEVDAFSTLGILSDPVYSYMVGYKVFSIANLIIHELTHATIYLKGQTQFNEELATFIGNKGALEFVRLKYGGDSREYRDAILTIEDRLAYRKLMTDLVSHLDSMYKSGDHDDLKIIQKQQMIDSFRINVKNNYAKFFKTPGYRNIESMKINNASLAVWMTYSMELDIYEQLYGKMGNSLRATMNFIKQLKDSNEVPKKIIKQKLLDCSKDNSSIHKIKS